MARDYDLPMEPALVACDLLLDLGAAASRRMMETGESPAYLEELCVVMVEGAARAVARKHKAPAPASTQRSAANSALRNVRRRLGRAQTRDR
jgi:hypothetical protein